ncbi:MAG: hypothetical protein HZA93_13670 [Verrucomicrobia bacterium]|nr:hypothetical protein [Verrucomicrobiota bacterium]
MRHLRLALVVFATLGLVRAQDEQQQKPPTEIPDFSNLDDYIYVPKSILSTGFRMLSGPKMKFGGKGRLATSEDAGARSATNIARAYHDGAVHLDTRATTRVDADGNPITDPVSGATLTDPIAPDGRTNSWNYISSKQLTADGLVALNNYTADVVDSRLRPASGTRNSGIELTVSRDMGKFRKTNISWLLMAGMTVNDLNAKTSDTVQSNLTTLTDLYSLNGQPVPDAPYTSPSTGTFSVTDANGAALLNPDGTAQSVTTDTSTLISSQPVERKETKTQDSTSVTNHWRVRGAYYTFRAGPTVFFPITTRLRANFSLGAALVYAGSTYTVTQSFAPDTGVEISDISENSTSKLLPGYYADATLQFELTERTGFYAGAVFQSTGAYTQNVNTTAAQYSSRIDLANQSGMRAGMTIRF